MAQTQLRPAPPARLIPLETVPDFRDLGGYLTIAGGRVRWRQLFRAGPLASASEADLRFIHDDLGVQTTIDLSSHDLPIASLLEQIARADGGVVFHCDVACDYVAVLAALVLGTLGVSDDDVLRDHALTPGADPSMKLVVRALRRGFGPIIGAVLDAGTPIEVIEDLHARLLE